MQLQNKGADANAVSTAIDGLLYKKINDNKQFMLCAFSVANS